ncbi:MAG: 2,3-bisphosphoglycerate-independent phosphoglycerate mutase [Patescibacteria group bacterium]|jgi:2,3-bisphosphoglycerate-independent phosphoglycerate mutase
MKAKRPVVLCIIDGWGIGTDDAHNAIFLADTPNIDKLLKEYPNAPIGAAGEHIGLTPGHQGSSEMGHMIIGAGRNVLLPQTQVKNEDYAKNNVLLAALHKAKRVHLLGLCSDKGVHSYLETGLAILKLAKQHKVKELYWHVIADGRDTPPKSTEKYIAAVAKEMKKTKLGKFGSLMGRWWIMDRDKNWDRIEKSYNTLFKGEALFKAADIAEAVKIAYERGETDELIKPTLIDEQAIIQEGDVVINFNYRVDREIELTQAICDKDFQPFKRPDHWNKIKYLALTEYYDNMPCPYIIKKEKPIKILGEILGERGYKQLRLAETEKWVYVTKCFNSMREEPFDNEDRILIPSDKVETFDQKPAMKAREIAKTLAENMAKNIYDVIILNFANPDMVGHTGNQPAIIKACEVVDEAVGTVYEACKKAHAVLLITADHGDAEINYDPVSKQPHTYHTDNFVPFILVDDEQKNKTISETGTLKDIAPTLLHLLKEVPPPEMTGKNIII